MAKRVRISTTGIINSQGQNLDQQLVNNLSEYAKKNDIKTMVAASSIKDANTIYKAGDNIIIEGDKISATAVPYGIATTTSSGLMSPAMFNKLNDISEGANNYSLPVANSNTLGGIKVGSNLNIYDGVLSAIETTYTAGSNISILNGKISAIDTKYSAGENIVIGADNKISAVVPTGTGGGISYTAGDNITITGNKISAKDTTYTAGSNVAITGNQISAKDTTYDVATTTKNGLMSSSMVTKLNGIATSANKYTLPTAKSNVLGGIMVGDNLSIDANGKLSAVKTTFTAGDNITISGNKISAKNTTYSVATTTANGLMGSAMVIKLNDIATSANKYTLPSATASTLGGIKVGSGLSIKSGTLTTSIAQATDKALGTVKLYTTVNGDAQDGTVTQRALSSAIVAAKVDTVAKAGYATSAGLASSAIALTTARTIQLTGYVQGSVKFNGASDAIIETTGKGVMLTASNYGYVASKTQAVFPINIPAGTYTIRPEYFSDMPDFLAEDSRCTIQVFETNSARMAFMFPLTKRQIYYAQQHGTSAWNKWRAIDNYCAHVVTNNLNDIKAPGRYYVVKSNTASAWTGAWTGLTASTLYLKCEGTNGTITSPGHSGLFMLWQYATTNDASANYYVRKLHANKTWAAWVKLNDFPDIQTATSAVAGITKLYNTNVNKTDGAANAAVTSGLYASNLALIKTISLTGAVTGKIAVTSNVGTIATTMTATPVTVPTAQPANPKQGTLWMDMSLHALRVYDTKSGWVVTRNP